MSTEENQQENLNPAQKAIQIGCGLMVLGIALTFLLPLGFLAIALILSQF